MRPSSVHAPTPSQPPQEQGPRTNGMDAYFKSRSEEVGRAFETETCGFVRYNKKKNLRLKGGIAKGKKVVSSLDFQEEVDTGAEQVNTAQRVNTGSIKLSTVSNNLVLAREQNSTVNLDKDDYEDSDEVVEQEESVTGTKTPINPVPVAMKIPSIATYKIIKQGEKGVYQIVREDGTDVVYEMNGPEDELEKVFWKYLKNMFEEPLSTDPIWSELGQQRIIRVNTPGSDENRLKLYDLMYIIVNVADMMDC
ncbi:hypothetical protein Tco_0393950 [Tanacetum coccineum]